MKPIRWIATICFRPTEHCVPVDSCMVAAEEAQGRVCGILCKVELSATLSLTLLQSVLTVGPVNLVHRPRYGGRRPFGPLTQPA